MGSNTLEKIRRIKTELTNKSSRIDDLSWNRPITSLNSTLSQFTFLSVLEVKQTRRNKTELRNIIRVST
jgi:hypothetical protein